MSEEIKITNTLTDEEASQVNGGKGSDIPERICPKCKEGVAPVRYEGYSVIFKCPVCGYYSRKDR